MKASFYALIYWLIHPITYVLVIMVALLLRACT